MQWTLTLSGPDLRSVALWIKDRIWRDAVPVRITSGGARTPQSDWFEHSFARAEAPVTASFGAKPDEYLTMRPRRAVEACFPFERDASAALTFLEGAPFAVAAFSTIYEEWDTLDPEYSPPSFGQTHTPLGWGCAFKGAGHDRLVSRRWLDVGPWRVLRGANDTTLVQFHSLAATPAVALKQAKRAHIAMGIDDSGGFLQEPFAFETKLKGLYDAAQQRLRIVVLGREIPDVELLDASAVRRGGTLGPDQPVRHVAYVFPDPKEAERNLPRLWPRELECWTIVDGEERRLDEDYVPATKPPAWVPKEH